MNQKGFKGVLLFLFLVPSILFAELLVYSDQYVVEPSAQVFRSQKLNVIKSVGKKSKLISKNAVSFRSASSIKVFDPQDDYCDELIAGGVAETCSPNFVIKVNAVPNDSQFSELWGLSSGKGIDAPSAWDLHTGSQNVVVAVIDTGVDYNHQDLKNNMWVNAGEIPNNGIDDDNNGYVDDVHGMSAINSSGNPMDDNGHGTHVAGTIGAKGNNGLGVAGVNWNVQIMALKFLDGNGYGGLAGAIEAIEYMTEMKKRGVNVKVSNNSWGGVGYSQGLYNAIKASIDAGVIFVAAAGNEANDNDLNQSYPASYEIDNLVSVAAIDQDQNLAGFSNYGAYSVDIAAPGVNILSTVPGNKYRSLSGTSMATPHVTGALTLLAASNSALSSSQIVQRLYDTGESLATLTGLTYTGRKLNLSRLLRNQTVPVVPPTSPSFDCSYNPSVVPYAPSYAADNQLTVIQADEYVFHTINLPFDFPYFDQIVHSLVVSPNGVIYVQTQPQDVDFQNSSAAPLNSIAALHTDLTTEGSSLGVRVAVSDTEVTIYWRAKQYNAQQGGDIEIRTTLTAAGDIKVFVSSDDANVISELQKAATIGISGARSGQKHTFAYNSTLIKNNLGVSFGANCGNQTVPGNPADDKVEIRNINAYTINAKGQQIKRLIPGRVLLMRFAGTGTGVVPMNIALDSNVCASDIPVSLTYGQNSFAKNTPRYLKRYKNIEFLASSANENIKIKRNRKNRKSLRSKVSESRYSQLLKRDCGRLIRKLGA